MRSSPPAFVGRGALVASVSRRSPKRTSRTRVHLRMYARIGRETDVCGLTCRYVEQVESADTLIDRLTRWFRDVNPWVLDAILGTAFTIFGLIGLFGPRDAKFDWRDPDAFAVLLSLGCSLPFYVRRRAPFGALLVCTVSLVTLSACQYPSNVQSQMIVI